MNIVKACESKQKGIFKFENYYDQETTNRPAINWMRIFLTLIVVPSISCMAFRPLNQNNQITICEYSDESYTNLSKIDKTIKRYNPEISKTIYLTSNYGSPIKTLKTYKYRENNEIKIILLFHITDMFTYELKLDTLIIEDNNIEIRKKIYDDASVIIGNAQDLLFYITLHEKDYSEIINSKELLFRINDMTLELSSDCKKAMF